MVIYGRLCWNQYSTYLPEVVNGSEYYQNNELPSIILPAFDSEDAQKQYLREYERNMGQPKLSLMLGRPIDIM